MKDAHPIRKTLFFSYLPQKKKEIFYRIPFKFLKRAKERLNDTLSSITPIMETIKEFKKVSESEETSDYAINDSIIEINHTNSDLWIKISDSNDTDGLIDTIENSVKSLNRYAYKYIIKDDQVLILNLSSGEWKQNLTGYIGLDAGSISINIALVDQNGIILENVYTLTEGDIINNIKKGFKQLSDKLPSNIEILGSGVTGSGHEISAAMLNADVYETELDAHAEATLHLLPDTQVIFDIGGQDSKVMYIEDGELDDAGMNKKCGAGTGAFLDAQADRLGIPIEKFGETGLKAKKPYGFSSMCTVFVGRDLIAEQAKGNTKENIIAGLHRSLAMNFYSTLGINKKNIKTPIAFQGGVASNSGVKKALENLLCEARNEEIELFIPMYHKVMGAIGMALFAKDEVEGKGKFRGIETILNIKSNFTECTMTNEIECGKKMICDIVHLYNDQDGSIVKTLYACDSYYKKINEKVSDENLKVSFGG